MSELITPIADDATHGWIIEINGARTKTVRHLKLIHPDTGILSFGLRPDKTVGWIWHPLSSETAVIPYSVWDGKLYIGLLTETRHTATGGWMWNIPRGSFRNVAAKNAEAFSRICCGT